MLFYGRGAAYKEVAQLLSLRAYSRTLGSLVTRPDPGGIHLTRA